MRKKEKQIQQAETERGLLGEIYFPEEEEDSVEIDHGTELVELNHLLDSIDDLKKNYLWTGKSGGCRR